ncbi:DapH/DapD/GlmU-related protein [Enterobacterales bacterium BD_CKDN230030183-1A_HGKHYDSX7]
MHNLFRLVWTVRALLYKAFFGRFSMPSYIGAPTFLLKPKHIYVGKRVRIFPGLRAECHGQGRIVLHDNISIGQNFHIIAGAELNVRSGCLISSNVFITDIDHTFDNPSIPVFDQPDKIRRTVIGENCFLGIGVRVQAGTTLGTGCVVGANSVIRGNFPDYCMIVGTPGRVVKRYDFVTGKWQSC